MAERSIKIFKTFEEQEAYHLKWLLNSSPRERFNALFKMQEFNKAIHKSNTERTIIIHHGYFK